MRSSHLQHLPSKGRLQGSRRGPGGASVLWGAPGTLAGRGMLKKDPKLSPRLQHMQENTF